MLNKNCMVNVKSYLVPLVLYFVFGLGCSEKASQDTTVKRPEKKVVEEAKTDQAEGPKVNKDGAPVKMVETDVTEPTNKEPEKEMVSRPAKTAMPTQSEPSSGGIRQSVFHQQHRTDGGAGGRRILFVNASRRLPGS